MEWGFKLQLKKFDLIYFFVIVVIIAGIIIRTKLLFLNPSYWYDTCSLASNLDKNFFDFFKPLENMQVAPPLFMVMSKLICSIFKELKNVWKTRRKKGKT